MFPAKINVKQISWSITFPNKATFSLTSIVLRSEHPPSPSLRTPSQFLCQWKFAVQHNRSHEKMNKTRMNYQTTKLVKNRIDYQLTNIANSNSEFVFPMQKLDLSHFSTVFPDPWKQTDFSLVPSTDFRLFPVPQIVLGMFPRSPEPLNDPQFSTKGI